MEIKRQHIFLVIFVFIIGVTIFIISKNIEILGLKGDLYSGVDIAKPAYLLKSIPKIDKIKTVVNNPKFKEMKYVEIFFEPVEVGLTGRANPFMPLRQEKETEEEKESEE